MIVKQTKLIVILGPTGSGKSSLAVKLARKFKGEIISADSRQIYKRLRIGSGVVTKKEMRGVKHHLLEFLDPKKTFSAGKFQKLALKKIKEIEKRKHLPFLVGGTGFYIDAVTGNKNLSKTKVNKKLRRELEKKTPAQLFEILKKVELTNSKKLKKSAKSRAIPRSGIGAGTIDKHNPRRLIRAIEILQSDINRYPLISKDIINLDTLYIGVYKNATELKRDLSGRFLLWLEAGFLMEAEKLIKLGVSRKKFKEFGLHYWYAYLFLKKEFGFKDFWNNSLYSLWHYAKRQNTWFKKNKNIHWVKTEKQAELLIKKFLNASEVQPEPW